uniref:C2H2-type domain-containing protein n=1 Tax=Romanomermis culicivorax TaxID=13658 RepID=A0A915J5X8_ROMCU
MSESPPTLEEIGCDKIGSRERNKRKRKIPTKETSRYLCEEEVKKEEIDAITCSSSWWASDNVIYRLRFCLITNTENLMFRAQEWLGQLQSEHGYCPEALRDEIVPREAKKESDSDKNVYGRADSANIDIPDANQTTTEALALRYIEEMKVDRSDFYPKCKICSKMFSNSTNLLVHYRSHAVHNEPGIKPFTCSICSASFSRRQSLQHHEMCHNDQSLYACPKCQATFRHRSHFKSRSALDIVGITNVRQKVWIRY